MTFAPEYLELVLKPNFRDAKDELLQPLLAIHRAHLVMLAEQGIIPRDESRMLRTALDRVAAASLDTVRMDGTCEDLFFVVDRLLRDAAGPEVAGRLHTARSRNDIDMTMYRMRQREMVLELSDATIELRRVLCDLVSRHHETVCVAHTHTQPAQPTTLAHYLLAVVEQLERDAERLCAAFATTNLGPLGSCAITGTGFPIDRRRTSDLLGFSGPTGNTYGSIATVDYLLQNLSAAIVLLVGLGRFVQDLLLWCTAEVGYLTLGEGFVQSSSIMPQKRNPVALEHARALASKAVGEAHAVTLTVHNTPFGDIVDTEDDLQPLVALTFRDARRAVQLVAAALSDATFDRTRMADRAGQGWITVTELADSIARDHGVPFTRAHAIAARVIRARTENPAAPLDEVVAAASRELLGHPVLLGAGEVERMLDPTHFVEARKTLGGPAPQVTREALSAARERLQRDRAWSAGAHAQLKSASARLLDACAAL
ncbi:MAG: argininosuccinate lyase [Acidobacteria bacterium]|nr:argininosuccinate lyase [Acidobacteriota bacterium]